MMQFGISGMIVTSFMRIIFNSEDTFYWMLFAIYGVIAICGAIRKKK